jgi:hypothetical protein
LIDKRNYCFREISLNLAHVIHLNTEENLLRRIKKVCIVRACVRVRFQITLIHSFMYNNSLTNYSYLFLIITSFLFLRSFEQQ